MELAPAGFLSQEVVLASIAHVDAEEASRFDAKCYLQCVLIISCWRGFQFEVSAIGGLPLSVDPLPRAARSREQLDEIGW